MIDLLERADPAREFEVDRDRLRSLVDERIGLVIVARPVPRPSLRRWMVAAAAFVAVLAIAVPVLLNRAVSPPAFFIPEEITQLPGIQSSADLASGGVQTMAVDGDTIWVMTALQNRLQKVSVDSGEIEASYEIDGYVEGVVIGNGYLWLMSYDNDGEVLRFDPASGAVDKRIPLGGLPGFARWFGGRLFVSNDGGELVEISGEGEVLSVSTGILKGDGLGFLWIFDPDDGAIRSLSFDGAVGEFVIPGNSPVLGDPAEVREVGEAGGFLWLIFGASGESVVRFDPANGELLPLHAGRWIHSLSEHHDALWVTSHTDQLLLRIDPETGEVRRLPVPGRPGGIASVDGELWLLLYQPGRLLRLDTSADLLESGTEIPTVTVGSDSERAHVLACTVGGVDSETLERVRVDGDFTGLGPTILLEPFDWIDYGSWSVVQAHLSNAGYVVCANGYSQGEATPEQRAADLERSLEASGIPGPYLLVAAGDGAHSMRLFADGRDDIAGVVFVEPMPIGFQEFMDGVLGEGRHPDWLDLDASVSESLDDFGDAPLVVIGHDPNQVFLHERFTSDFGQEAARAISDYWQRGLDFYAGLSTNSRELVVDTGLDGVIWFRPDVIADTVLEIAEDQR